MSLIKLEQIAVLKSIEEASGEPLISRLVDMFESEFPSNILLFKNFISQNNLPELFALAHKLKSSCLNLGTTKMGEICQEIEINARDHKDIDYSSFVLELEQLFPEVIKALRNS